MRFYDEMYGLKWIELYRIELNEIEPNSFSFHIFTANKFQFIEQHGIFFQNVKNVLMRQGKLHNICAQSPGKI